MEGSFALSMRLWDCGLAALAWGTLTLKPHAGLNRLPLTAPPLPQQALDIPVPLSQEATQTLGLYMQPQSVPFCPVLRSPLSWAVQLLGGAPGQLHLCPIIKYGHHRGDGRSSSSTCPKPTSKFWPTFPYLRPPRVPIVPTFQGSYIRVSGLPQLHLEPPNCLQVLPPAQHWTMMHRDPRHWGVP